MARRQKDKSVTPDNPHGDHVEFGADQLREALALLKPVLYRRATRHDCNSYHLTAEQGGTVTIAATDLRVRMQIRLTPIAATGMGTIMIDAHALGAMLDSYHEPRVRIHLGGTSEIRLEGLRSKLWLPGHDPARELKAPVEGCLVKSGWFFEGLALAEATRRTKFAIDEESTRYALGGLLLRFPGEGDVAEIVGCDGRRLARVGIGVARLGSPGRLTRPQSEPASQPTEGMPVLPIKAALIAERLARRAGHDRIGIGVIPGRPIDLAAKTYEPGLIQVVTRDVVLTAVPVEGRFPTYTEVIPSGTASAEARIDHADRLGELLALARAGTDSEAKGTEVVMAGGTIMLATESGTKGKAQLALTGVDMDGTATFDVDAMMFRQIFDVLGEAPVVIKFYGRKDPILIRSGSFDAIQMPLTRDRVDRPEAKADAPETDAPDGDGEVPIGPVEPAPPVPAGATPEAHEANGKARHGKPK
jgi:DNA polymerase-3 subunit beta